MEIKDKVIIITGASQGIGLAAAKHLSKLGAKVVLAARSKDLIEKLGKELPNSLVIVTDMRKLEDIKRMVDKTLEKYGRIDILINNAGQGSVGNVENINIDDYKRIMDLNVYSIVEAMQMVIPHMRKQGGGMIVNISSQVTKIHIPSLSAYSSTKYALNSITMTARTELAKDKIIVNMVLPKMTSTNFMKNSIGSDPKWMSGRPMPKVDTPEIVAKDIERAIRSEEAEIIV